MMKNQKLLKRQMKRSNQPQLIPCSFNAIFDCNKVHFLKLSTKITGSQGVITIPNLYLKAWPFGIENGGYYTSNFRGGHYLSS